MKNDDEFDDERDIVGDDERAIAAEQRRLSKEQRRLRRTRRRLRLRRHGRRAYIRSVYFLPSLATLGNAICGFGACYVAALTGGEDPLAQAFFANKFLAAAYLIFAAMVFDALDGRLARLTRHTTDFGGQLDSLADVVSFGFAPAFISLLLFKEKGPSLPVPISRLVWALGAIYFSCAAIRLARFNVSNKHGEQHHFSFLGLPSPGAAAAVVGLILMQQDLHQEGWESVSYTCVIVLPIVVLATGLLMVSHFRYRHVVNTYLRGRHSIGRLIAVLTFLLLVVVAHRYLIGFGALVYALGGPLAWLVLRFRPKHNPPAT